MTNEHNPLGISFGNVTVQGHFGLSTSGDVNIQTSTGELQQIQNNTVDVVGIPVSPEQKDEVFAQVDQIGAEVENNKERFVNAERLQMAHRAVKYLKKQLSGKREKVNSAQLAKAMRYAHRCGGSVAAALLLFFKDALANRIFETIGGPALKTFWQITRAGSVV